ncbi:diacylglycerol kinase family lipid kinase [Spirosoma sp. HMF4905]|uniref:Diacylglycerol kinase family lipid kinase n=1 Tax=Spirosoma arboris TaxID=2682092 RepID=A0A7K1S493_9BACT|nr:diacylglycerol kinase family protein [Spirosoma arboris]MVM28634.1 diacylglycerol kinase family lipid kinase [Spirosoma arboris]
MTFLFAINPVSGGTDKTVWENGIQTYFADSPHTVHQFYLDGKTDNETIPQQIEQHKPDCVVAAGGDGTIKLVAEHLLNTSILLGILPVGSANGMARELGIHTDVHGSLDTLVNGISKRVDVVSVNDGESCLHLSDIGLNAQLVKYYQRNNLRGKLGYLRGVIKVLHKHRLMKVSITVGDECIHRAAFMIVLANARMYGTGAVINPDGDVSDGKFEVIIFRRLSIGEILKLFWRFQPFDPKKIEIIPATSVSIETHRKAYFQVDGEYRGQITTLKANIRPGALTIRVPEPTTPKPAELSEPALARYIG